MPKNVNQDANLYNLIPKPIIFHENGLDGCLYVDGNISHNFLLFRFRFDTETEVAPILLTITVGDESYHFSCSIKDLTNPEMKTQIITPDFDISSDIKAISLKPLFQKT